MRRLEIDIAIDLKGYTGGARPGIFALGPAPVTVNYLGYPGTIGGDFMNYIFADAVSLPMDSQAFYSEKIVHLPGSYQPNDPQRMIGKLPSRAEAGLPAEGFVFCCFNNHWKITRPVFESWMRILKAAPDSVLWLLSDSADAALARAAQAEGIDSKRLIFAPRLPHADHLGRLGLAGLMLDTLPYNAHTTASDALWCGVPVLTVAGQSFAARVAASLNTAIGLPELIAKSLAAYEEGAVAIAKDPKKLKALKTKLAKNRGAKPLFDAPAFATAIEAAYSRILEAARRGDAPNSFALSPD
jgi:predicted O-linked N-acetylglucosamine transferase (SPINDLY family)